MFYGEGSDQPLFLLRKMIAQQHGRRAARRLDELFPFMKADMKATMEAMDGLPVTIRLLDPPLHEFVPQDAARQKELADVAGHPAVRHQETRRGPARDQPHDGPPRRAPGHHLSGSDRDAGPGHLRGRRRAEDRPARTPKPEIMVPVTCDETRTRRQKMIFDRVQKEVEGAVWASRCACLYGTMIEIPRACLTADKMAKTAEFFSFGTNDLTQMGFGFSRDDIGSFLHDYLEDNILPADPFQTIDQEGVGQLIQMAVSKGRATRGNLKIGICGEQGGDPASRRVLLPQRDELRQLLPVPRAHRPLGRRPSSDQGKEITTSKVQDP